MNRAATAARLQRVDVANLALCVATLAELDAVQACPHFGVVWPSALGLGEHLAGLLRTRSKSYRAPADVLELGSGLAIPSLVARTLGARRVVASDRHPAVSRLLAENVSRNGLRDIEYQDLDWRRGGRDPESLSGLGRFDLVIGSDLLYEPWQPGALAAVLPYLLKPEGEALIADPGRRYVDAFVRLAEATGFRCDLDAIRTVAHGSGPVDVLVVAVRG